MKTVLLTELTQEDNIQLNKLKKKKKFLLIVHLINSKFPKSKTFSTQINHPKANHCKKIKANLKKLSLKLHILARIIRCYKELDNRVNKIQDKITISKMKILTSHWIKFQFKLIKTSNSQFKDKVYTPINTSQNQIGLSTRRNKNNENLTS